MDSKLVSRVNLSEAQAKYYGINIADSVFDELIQQEMELFLKLEQSAVKNDGVKERLSSAMTQLASAKIEKNTPFLALLNRVYGQFSNEFKFKRWLPLTGDAYFDKKAKGCWYLPEGDELNKATISQYLDQNTKNTSVWQWQDFSTGTNKVVVEQNINKQLKDIVNHWTLPNKQTLNCMTNLSDTIFKIEWGRFHSLRYGLFCEEESEADAVSGFDCDSDVLTIRNNGCPLPFLPFEASIQSGRKLFIEFILRGLTPLVLEGNKDYLFLLAIVHRQLEGAFTQDQSKVESFLQRQLDLDIESKITTGLLNEDKLRADIAPLHQKVLEDTALGHWSLWQDAIETSNSNTFSLPSKLVAKDPNSSINDGVVGIDFGTKSTVVVYQKDNVNIHPMRIGTGDLAKEIKAHHYENPTVMEFNDLAQFIGDYHAKANKPYTRWQDLTISHTAQNSLLGCESSQFNTFLDEIKQWAGDSSRKLKIVGKQGQVIDLPPFLKLTDEEFNPIEIYAYYLGLYINTQSNGIYLDYILSFPVTYEMPIRDKIIESFKKGLKKSLPAELGEQGIAQLSVTKGASEPAAYALVALQAYDFDPTDEEHIFYSVFDFGGGTTDFDFGIFREANGTKERRFDYVVEHFGAGGDKFLGGENLLELLAFEIFKNNKTELLKHGIQFEKHPEKDAFAGSEQLLNSSQEAKINTKSLCEALRPFWEGRQDSGIDLSQGQIAINLRDVNGQVQTGFELDVNEDALNDILNSRIERGVMNFFNALRLAFSNSKLSLHQIDKIQIFLAGNSSKSPIVKMLFEKHIALQHQEMERTEDQASRFELYPPLGGDDGNVEKPTGKTGVAFGLIEAREGGSIKVIDHNISDDNIRFKYYLGGSRKKRFKPLVDRETAFNQWVEFIDASSAKCELFYTEQSLSSTGQVSIADDSIKKRTIILDTTDDEALVYLRVISPTCIEYVIAHEEQITSDTYINAIQSIELS
ncbi:MULTISPECIES: hypothetical protein [unclassified Shewanella]|uniref:hypothetical protein n=1 Tax=unclassified Shewanella TaxID=196818 RepID=UPI00354C9113